MRALLCLAAMLAPLPLAAQDAPHGWHARYTQKTGVGGDVHAVSPSAAFALDDAATLHPLLRRSGWVARYEGRIAVPPASPADSQLRFALEVAGGSATLEVKDASGKVVATCATGDAATAETAWQPLTGEVQVAVEFTRAARGKARLRTLWEMQPSPSGGFRPEPIPSSAVRVPDAAMALLGPEREVERGRVLLRENACTRCHASSDPALASPPAPSLPEAARVASAAWMGLWIRMPQKIDAHSRMPDLLSSHASPDETALDLLHFVKSLQPESAREGEAPVKNLLGRRLFHTIGCAACHGPLASPFEVFEDPQLARTPPEVAGARDLAAISGKWQSADLERFLREPAKLHPDGRMPRLTLKTSESRAIADYVLATVEREWKPRVPFAADAERAARGKSEFQAMRCANCHEIDAVESLPARPLELLDPAKGCLDPQGVGTPRYPLDDSQRAALAAAVNAAKAATGVPAPIVEARTALAELRCSACHAKDGNGGVPAALKPYFIALDDRVDLGDEGRIPPDLSSVGFKLHTPWIDAVLTKAGRARPYMACRMPQFDAPIAPRLSAALAAIDGIEPGADVPPPASDDSAIADGRQLLGSAGMNCINCHEFRDFPPVGSPGPNVQHFADRLRYEWWRAYIQAPARFKPGTRMPAFSVGRKSTVPAIAGGDIYRQGDALWGTFLLGDAMPVPDGVKARDSFKLVVRDRPIVMRTFLESAGSRGIAVGMPAGVHYAFDAERVRLVDAWRGDFLDASGAWSGRGGTPVDGLGPSVWSAPPGMPLRADDPAGSVGAKSEPPTGKAAGYRFRGYELDAAGVPTFLYDALGAKVRERIDTAANPQVKLVRAFAVDGAPREFWLDVGAGNAALKDVKGADASDAELPGWKKLVTTDAARSVRFSVEVTP